MSAPTCPTCGGWGYFTDCDSWGNDPRVVPCWRGCPTPELPTLADAEAARMAERHAAEDYITRIMESEI